MSIGKFCLKNNVKTRVKKHREHLQKILDQKNQQTSSYVESSFSTVFISQPNPPGVVFSTPEIHTTSISDPFEVSRGGDSFQTNADFETKYRNDGVFSYCVLFKSRKDKAPVKLTGDEKLWG